MGVNVSDTNPFASNEPTNGGDSEGMSQSAIDAIVASIVPGWGGPKCKVDGAITGCRLAASVLSSGAGVRVSDNAASGVFIKFTNLTNGQSTSIWSPLRAIDLGGGITWTGNLPMGAQLGVDGHPDLFEINLAEIAANGSRNMTYVGMLTELPGSVSFDPPQNADSLWGRRRHPQSKKQKPMNWGTSCAKFARSLADRLYNAAVRDRPYGDDNASNLGAAGVPMRVQALTGPAGVDESGNPYRKGKTPIDGFKEYLTAHGQDADVYHHILFVAGNILDHDGSTPGFLLNQAFIAYDRAQAASGRKESEAELADDDAGEKVGYAMLKTGRKGASGDYEGLALTIARILCK